MITAKDNKLVYLSKDVTFKGTIESPHNLYLAGKISGEINTQQDAYILRGAELKADIKAENIQTFGVIEGNLDAHHTMVMNPDARVFGKITCESLSLDEGAIYCGSLDVTQEASPAASS